MGSPSVFQTAPPQPASNARMTCSPQLAGGPDASQKGFGQRMPPAKTVVRSAMGGLHVDLRSKTNTGKNACATCVAQAFLPVLVLSLSYLSPLQPTHNPKPRSFAFRHRIHHFAPAVHAIAASIVARICGSSGHSIGDYGSIFHFHAAALA